MRYHLFVQSISHTCVNTVMLDTAIDVWSVVGVLVLVQVYLYHF